MKILTHLRSLIRAFNWFLLRRFNQREKTSEIDESSLGESRSNMRNV